MNNTLFYKETLNMNVKSGGTSGGSGDDDGGSGK